MALVEWADQWLTVDASDPVRRALLAALSYLPILTIDASLGRIVGEQGSVVSLDVDSSLAERARIKHAQNDVGNVTVHTADGYAG